MLKSLEIKGFTGGNRENEIRNRNCTQKPSFSRKDIVVRKFQFEKLRKSEFEEHHRYD